MGTNGTTLPVRQWPTLVQAILTGAESQNALANWREGLKWLRQFRQEAKLGRDAGNSRSRWPEPESVRELVVSQRKLGTRTGMHAVDSRFASKTPRFPRAEFGLPIIFEILRECVPGKNENLKPTLQYDEQHDRLASPVILRPLMFANGSSAPMALFLRTQPLPCAYLKQGKADLQSDRAVTAAEIRSRNATYPSDCPLNRYVGTTGDGSALASFANYLTTVGATLIAGTQP